VSPVGTESPVTVWQGSQTVPGVLRRFGFWRGQLILRDHKDAAQPGPGELAAKDGYAGGRGRGHEDGRGVLRILCLRAPTGVGCAAAGRSVAAALAIS
jgi:hypothetical protein